MSEFMPGVGPAQAHQVEINQQLLAEPTIPSKPTPPLTPEQLKAVDAALTTSSDRESATVAGLIGLWGSSMLLKDLAKEHFSPPAGEENDKEKPKPPEEG